MNLLASLTPEAELSARLIRADGTHRDRILSYDRFSPHVFTDKVLNSMPFLKRLYWKLRGSKLIPAAMGFAAFVHYLHTKDSSALQALVTTAGINILAADFAPDCIPFRVLCRN